MINEVKVTEIERENRILYEKMSQIYTRKNKFKFGTLEVPNVSNNENCK